MNDLHPLQPPHGYGHHYDLVIPTTGRSSLYTLLEVLRAGQGPRPDWTVIVDDRRRFDRPLDRDDLVRRMGSRLWVVESGGRGPARARNVGWRTTRAPWVAFLDDDVEPESDWMERLFTDLASADARIGGVQGHVSVPVPHRPLTDWERQVQGLETASWATADMTYRRSALIEVGGFDEQFPRAFREDADLALRVQDAGWTLAIGTRRVRHPVRPASQFISVRRQLGNADDAVMLRRHGRSWRRRAHVTPGRRPRHLIISAAALVVLWGRRRGRSKTASLAGLIWLAGTTELMWRRIIPGPRDRREVAAMVSTSLVIPFVATAAWLVGLARAFVVPRRRSRPSAVLFDRDGTLIHDVPYNGDPARVSAIPGARSALDFLRSSGIATGIVTNQSGVAKHLLDADAVHAVNRRVEDLIGPVGVWAICPHDPADACGCRKPAPGLVSVACDALGVEPRRSIVIGDIESDLRAAEAAGARAVLVPNGSTDVREIGRARDVATCVVDAVSRFAVR